MGRLLLPVILSAGCLLGGCTVLRIVPPVQGSVVDAVTGVPIKSAKVTIKYFNSQRESCTDAQGQFAFGPRYNIYGSFINVHVDRDSWFSLHVEADGYKAVSTGRYSGFYWEYWERLPPEFFEEQQRRHGIKWTGESMVFPPIKLAPATETGGKGGERGQGKGDTHNRARSRAESQGSLPFP